jgi:hypothetical protein
MLYTRVHPVYTPPLCARLRGKRRPVERVGIEEPEMMFEMAARKVTHAGVVARSTTASGAWRTLVRSLREEQVRLTV